LLEVPNPVRGLNQLMVDISKHIDILTYQSDFCELDNMDKVRIPVNFQDLV
jgi:hypothetical protein